MFNVLVVRNVARVVQVDHVIARITIPDSSAESGEWCPKLSWVGTTDGRLFPVYSDDNGVDAALASSLVSKHRGCDNLYSIPRRLYG